MVLDNINICKLPVKEQERVLNLLNDLKELNALTKYDVQLSWQDWHNDSPEYPDYYGTYRLKCNGETLGLEMDLSEVDNAICVLIDIFKIEKYGKV